MKVQVTLKTKHLVSFKKHSELLANGKWKQEAQRGVMAATKKVKTKVQKAAAKQMALKPGNYQSYVVKNTRAFSKPAELAGVIVANNKGGKIEIYKGLKALSSKGRTAKRYNSGRSVDDQGFVKSGVWNAPRTFKRSFSSNGGFFALIPGGSTSSALPKEFWTFGKKSSQPRDTKGRFKSSQRAGYRVRRLFGPALGKEMQKDQALITFKQEAPKELRVQVEKRIAKLVKF
ncbi:hypothetical protein SAMN05421798_11069 [Pseudovibrio axinellae]|uniref:hypothetical protein n=1 Tax=Pseudovibrio axinellae TaxID=989403 RepID=UPI0008B06DAB|nr:hypothetical protein [Pseudovibrio axinellae]SER44015.1 hypothetical protein SAMN05421798_11069 [Pseudovibrio axinellae]